MTGKYIEFTNVRTGEVIQSGLNFHKKVGLSHYKYSMMMKGSGLTGKIYVGDDVWTFNKRYKNMSQRSYIPNGNKRVYNIQKVNDEKPLPAGDREYKQDRTEGELYEYKVIGNFLCTYSVVNGRLMNTQYVDNGADPIKGMMPECGETTIIDKILSGEIFINMKIM